MFLITQPNGLFYQYLQKNAINYSCEASSESGSLTPLNLQVTISMLSFMKDIFAMPDKFTKYVFDDELMLFYIRTHYISFVRLYNKNFNSNKMWEETVVE